MMSNTVQAATLDRIDSSLRLLDRAAEPFESGDQYELNLNDGTFLFVQLLVGGFGAVVLGDEGEFLFSVPISDPSGDAVEAFYRVYSVGYERGHRWGQSSGRHEVQDTVLGALGVTDRVLDLESRLCNLENGEQS